MKNNYFPDDIKDYVVPSPKGNMFYKCLGCEKEYPIDELLYICPNCGKVLLLHDRNFENLKKISGEKWRKILDFRRLLKTPAVSGIYRYHEFLGSVIPLESVVYLGEGHTPMIEANNNLKNYAGVKFYYKNDGQNPSASFKDRGMASALSYINFLLDSGKAQNILAVCASTGDTSAAAALYAAYLYPKVKSAVLLPHKKVTPQQLSQPLGSGASVFEIPGVFDDCMKVVEYLSENYNVALLNSKNAWRILGQESFSFEIAQDFDYDMKNKAVFVPIGNAGNITAVLNGFMKFFELGIIEELPKIIGVQSEHANPVFKYYLEKDPKKRVFEPMIVQPSVAQAAMIGNPVSMPRVIHLVNKYNLLSQKNNVDFICVTEQEIMDNELKANRNGHIACTHGGETLAGLVKAVSEKIIDKNTTAVIDSTAHALKFSGFQDMYFEKSIPDEYEITPDESLINLPSLIMAKGIDIFPAPGKPLGSEKMKDFVKKTADEIAKRLNL
ncbi:MAG: threonine synthase [Desulforegulaceae bacterium]|nr:threonine synthase [Desulforegulaceae bacterium]